MELLDVVGFSVGNPRACRRGDEVTCGVCRIAHCSGAVGAAGEVPEPLALGTHFRARICRRYVKAGDGRSCSPWVLGCSVPITVKQMFRKELNRFRKEHGSECTHRGVASSHAVPPRTIRVRRESWEERYD